MESLSRQVSWIVFENNSLAPQQPVDAHEGSREEEDQECIAALFPEKKAEASPRDRYHPELAVLETDEVCPYRLAVTFEVRHSFCQFCLYLFASCPLR